MMEKRWLGFSLRLLLSLALLYCIYLVATRAIAHWYFRNPTPERLRQAIRFDPGNPMYYAALARVTQYSPEGGDLEEVIRLYEQATRLSPHRASYWAELAGAYELAGRLEPAAAAYARAQHLFPNSPDINWQVGNFYLRSGKTREALAAFQKVLLGDPQLRQQAFDLAWRATEDTELILAEMIPAQTEIYFQYLNYLIGKQRIDAASAAWSHLLTLNLAFAPRAAFPYLDALIRYERVDELVAAWAAVAERNPVQFRRSRFNRDLCTNGDFESEILNGGLGWRVTPVEGVVASVDSLTFFDGTHALKIRFDGTRNLDYRHVMQYVPVKPNTLYRFMGYMRIQDITTNSGPRFQLYDPYDTSRLFLTTENLVGTTNWSPQQLEFKTSPETRLLVIRVARPPSRKFDNLIAGSVWLDRLSLTPVE
ncbi:MAG: tetratricopeptide repeat protein [Terriglobia bacterium]